MKVIDKTGQESRVTQVGRLVRKTAQGTEGSADKITLRRGHRTATLSGGPEDDLPTQRPLPPTGEREGYLAAFRQQLINQLAHTDAVVVEEFRHQGAGADLVVITSSGIGVVEIAFGTEVGSRTLQAAAAIEAMLAEAGLLVHVARMLAVEFEACAIRATKGEWDAVLPVAKLNLLATLATRCGTHLDTEQMDVATRVIAGAEYQPGECQSRPLSN